ncbi:MAG: hypothetical protein ACKVPX_11260 [Myxococcaceae bacterium]
MGRHHFSGMKRVGLVTDAQRRTLADDDKPLIAVLAAEASFHTAW